MTPGYNKVDGNLSGVMKLEENAPPSSEIDTDLERMVGQSNESLKGELQEEIRNVKQTVEALRAEFHAATQLIENKNSYGPNQNSHRTDNSGSIRRRKPGDKDDEADIIVFESFDADKYVKSQLFVGSTHRYLFMDAITNDDGTSYEVTCNGRLLAVAVLLFQLVTYATIALMGFNEGKTIRKSWDHPTVEIAAKYCYDTEKYGVGVNAIHEAFIKYDGYNNLMEGSVTADTIVEMLECSSPIDRFDPKRYEERYLFYLRSGVATILLLSFLIGDIFESFTLWRCKGWRAKTVSAVILFEAAVALSVAFMGVDLVEELGMLSSFLLFVGLIFVHDVDEQFGRLQDLIQRLKHNYCRLFELKFWLFALAFLVVTQGPRWFLRKEFSSWI